MAVVSTMIRTNILRTELETSMSIYYPLIGPYDASDEAVIEYHIRLGKLLELMHSSWTGMEFV